VKQVGAGFVTLLHMSVVDQFALRGWVAANLCEMFLGAGWKWETGCICAGG
jgi:hypothetical protein